MSAPTVSVIVPCYGGGAELRAAVDSALSQTFEDLELLVVDDASPEPIEPSLEGVDDPRMRVLRRSRNGGPAAARNTGRAEARGAIIAPLDSDDSWLPGYLQTVLPYFEDTSVGLVYTNGELLGPNGSVVPLHRSAAGHPVQSFDELARGNSLRVPGTSFRREALDSVGGYPPSLRICHDWWVTLSLLKHGWRAAYCPELLFRYDVPDYTTHWYDQAMLDREELRMLLRFAARDPALLVHRELRWRARRELLRLVRVR
jgi:glycosyltransferase involved in cell wall biosynthesis